MRITAIAPGARELVAIALKWRHIGSAAWAAAPMQHAGRRTYTYELSMPHDAEAGIEFLVEATFAGAPPRVVVAPPAGSEPAYVVTP